MVEKSTERAWLKITNKTKVKEKIQAKKKGVLRPNSESRREKAMLTSVILHEASPLESIHEPSSKLVCVCGGEGG